MKSNKIISFSLLMGVLIINLSAGCSEKSEETKPDSFQSLVGRWEVQRSVYNIIEQDGDTKQSTTEIKANGINVIWEFFADGRLLVSQDGVTQETRWSLNVTKTDVKDIEEGKLTVISESGKALAESIGQTGDLAYDISTAIYTGKPTILSLDLDVTKIGPYRENILRTTFHKL
jgi:hypothetical protein